jgi:hypothetical protein
MAQNPPRPLRSRRVFCIRGENSTPTVLTQLQWGTRERALKNARTVRCEVPPRQGHIAASFHGHDSTSRTITTGDCRPVFLCSGIGDSQDLTRTGKKLTGLDWVLIESTEEDSLNGTNERVGDVTLRRGQQPPIRLKIFFKMSHSGRLGSLRWNQSKSTPGHRCSELGRAPPQRSPTTKGADYRVRGLPLA